MELNESSYYTDVYYDILDDDICLWTRYRFETKELAEEFIKNVPFLCTEIVFEKKRHITGYTEAYPYRPRFSVLSDALVDAQDFNKYCDSSDYKYHNTVFHADLSEIETLSYKNKIKSLEKENKELKTRISELESKSQRTDVMSVEYD